MAPSALQNYQPQNLCNEKNYPETISEVSVPQLRRVKISILIGGLVFNLVFVLRFFFACFKRGSSAILKALIVVEW